MNCNINHPSPQQSLICLSYLLESVTGFLTTTSYTIHILMPIPMKNLNLAPAWKTAFFTDTF